jgi:hypothetical protein
MGTTYANLRNQVLVRFHSSCTAPQSVIRGLDPRISEMAGSSPAKTNTRGDPI